MTRGIKSWVLAGVGLLLAGCGGSDAAPPAGAAVDPGPQGFYTGSFISETSGFTLPAFALVTDDGRIRIVEPVLGRQFMAVFPAAAAWQGALTGYSGPLADFPDGKRRCTGSVSGDAFAAAELIGRYACGGDHGRFDLSYDDNTSFDPQDTGLLAGLAEFDSSAGDITLLHIAPDGGFTGSDTAGCTYHGGFSVADPIVDIYTLELTRGCAGHETVLKGSATLATDPVSGDPALYFAVSGGGDSLAGLLVFQ